jgi:redox-sensitive bicupin YhaK (pirin superfamily)
MTIDFKNSERGTSTNDWLDSQHTFSFGEFQRSDRMGFRNLRVINEDHVSPAGGFAPHGHRDMEIITFVTSGALGHKDSLGNGSVIRPGEIQRMSAGTGIRHSEMNASDTEPVHFLQIWIEPDANGYQPSYEQVELISGAGEQGFTPIASPEGGKGAISLNQDAVLSISRPAAGENVTIGLGEGRYGFVHVVQGSIEFAGKTYGSGDGIGFDSSDGLASFAALEASEVLFFDLA